MRWISFKIALLASSTAVAALSTDAHEAMSFYRGPQSAFPSGQLSRAALDAKLSRTETQFHFLVSWDKKVFNLPGPTLLRDIHVTRFAETKTGVELLRSNLSSASAVKSLPGTTGVQILGTDSYWAKVMEAKTGVQGWIPLHLLQAHRSDQGVFINLIDTYLRKTPVNGSEVITTLPRLQRIVPLAFEKGFLKIKYNQNVGYVDITHLTSKADFANLAYHKEKKWQAVTHRDGDALVTVTGERLPLAEIIGYVTNNHRGIVSKPLSANGPQIRSRVEILKPQANIWGISKIDGHGEVWWKKSDLLLEEKAPNHSTITTDELMKREIYSIAFENKNSVRGLVSSEGVYRTEDGKTWTLIPQFSKGNFPVSIHPNGSWFIGSYQSKNQGRSFEPFIRWDRIAEAIESTYHRNPKILKLTQIQALPNSQIQIFVETGLNRVKLRSTLSAANYDWKVVKN